MATEKFPISEEIEQATVVDTDFHVSPIIKEDLSPYLESPAIKRSIDVLPPGPLPFTGYMWPGWSTNRGDEGLRSHGRAHTSQDIIEAIEMVGTDKTIITPGMNYLPAAQIPSIKNELVRAYNDYILDILDEVNEETSDVYGMMMLPQWDPQAMTREIERVGDEELFVGAYGWYDGSLELLGLPDYDTSYELLVDLELPFSLHVGATFWPRTQNAGSSIRTWSESLGLSSSVHAMMQATNMIFTGVFDKFPNLQIGMLEPGITWVPFLGLRMDEFYTDHSEDVKLTERMHDMDKEYLDKMPSEYLQQNFAFSSQPIALPKHSRHAQTFLEMMNAKETLMFATDWPHHTIDLPNWLFEQPAIDDELRERIFHKNAEELFGI